VTGRESSRTNRGRSRCRRRELAKSERESRWQMLVLVEDAKTAREKFRGIYRQYWPSQCPSAQCLCQSVSVSALVTCKPQGRTNMSQFYRVRKKTPMSVFQGQWASNILLLVGKCICRLNECLIKHNPKSQTPIEP
jgi:hypothetical protein